MLWIGICALVGGLLVTLLFLRAEIRVCAMGNGLNRAGLYLHLSLAGVEMLFYAAIRRSADGRLYYDMRDDRKKVKKPHNWLRFYKELHRRLFQAMQVDWVDAWVREGTGDAAETAILSGGVRAALGAGAAVLQKKKPGVVLRLRVIPCYGERCFQMQVYGIAHMHVGHAMVAVIRAALSRNKGG